MELSRSLPEWEGMTDREKRDCFHADFSIDLYRIYLGTRVIGDISQATLERIQQICYVTKGYVPFLLRNTRFTSRYTVTVFEYTTPEVTLQDISDGSIVGYRQKIDGALVWRAHYSDGHTVRVGWAGGLSCPAYIATLETFEVEGMSAYAIRPWNVKALVFFPEVVMTFKERRMSFSILPEWEEGAIAAVQTRQSVIEKKLKRVPTAEVSIMGQRAIIAGVAYPVHDDGEGMLEDGVYEATFTDGEVVAVAFRPWKKETKNFFRAVRAATVYDAVDLFAYPVRYEGASVNRVQLADESSVLYLPRTLEYPPVYADARMIGGVLEVSAVLTRQSEAVPCQYDVSVTKSRDGYLVTGGEYGEQSETIMRPDGAGVRTREVGRLILEYNPKNLVLRAGTTTVQIHHRTMTELDMKWENPRQSTHSDMVASYYWLFTMPRVCTSHHVQGVVSICASYRLIVDYGRAPRGHFTNLVVHEPARAVPTRKKAAFYKCS